MSKTFLNASDIADILGISASHAYKIINQLNEELSERGYFVVRGKVNRTYFEERFYLKPVA